MAKGVLPYFSVVIQTDADSRAVFLADFKETCELLARLTVVTVEIAGVDTDLVHHRGHGDSSRRGEVDIRYDRGIDPFRAKAFPDFGDGRDFPWSGDSDADDLRTGFSHPDTLPERGFNIVSMGVAHGLHHDGMSSADGDVAAFDFESFHSYSSPKTIFLASLRSMALVLPVFLDIWKCNPAVTMTSKGYANE